LTAKATVPPIMMTLCPVQTGQSFASSDQHMLSIIWLTKWINPGFMQETIIQVCERIQVGQKVEQNMINKASKVK
jgi:hypothetical protein